MNDQIDMLLQLSKEYCDKYLSGIFDLEKILYNWVLKLFESKEFFKCTVLIFICLYRIYAKVSLRYPSLLPSPSVDKIVRLDSIFRGKPWNALFTDIFIDYAYVEHMESSSFQFLLGEMSGGEKYDSNAELLIVKLYYRLFCVTVEYPRTYFVTSRILFFEFFPLLYQLYRYYSSETVDGAKKAEFLSTTRKILPLFFQFPYYRSISAALERHYFWIASSATSSSAAVHYYFTFPRATSGSLTAFENCTRLVDAAHVAELLRNENDMYCSILLYVISFLCRKDDLMHFLYASSDLNDVLRANYVSELQKKVTYHFSQLLWSSSQDADALLPF